MSDNTGAPYGEQPRQPQYDGHQYDGQQDGGQPYGQPRYAVQPGQSGHVPAYGYGPPGKIRPTGVTILLYLVTCGIYGFVWYYQVHDEMKRHSGQGIGGPVALLLSIFVGIASVFLAPHEVGELFARQGRQKPVSAITGLWVLLPLVGGIVWVVKTNGRLNEYWQSMGVRPA